MRSTLDRYVLREILPPFLLALLIFTFLLVLPPVMDYLENLLAKGVTWGIAARILWTLIPQALGLTIPMAVLVGILIALGRMSSDRESVALLACGVSPYRLLRPIGALAIVATLATAYVMIVAIPNANQTFREITFRIVTQKVESDIAPRVFYQDFPGWVLYAREEPDPGQTGWKKVMVAQTGKSGETTLYFSQKGRLVVDRPKRTVDLVLTDGTIYRTTKPGETETTRFPADIVLGLNPDDVFPKINIQPGLNEKTIAQLRQDAADKVKSGLSPHPEVIAIQQKFSFPTACVVFAIIGLALGLTVARDGKLAGFVVGVVVIFAYYIVMFLSESLTKGYMARDVGKDLAASHYLNMYLTRWLPNIAVGVFGVIALIWRARHVEGRLPFRLPVAIARTPLAWRRRALERLAAQSGQPVASEATDARPAPARRAARPPVLVVRIPRVRMPAPGLLDRYITRIYLRIVGLSFFALLGLFYISTFLDRSDKIFKGQATPGDVGRLLVYMTPQFIYYVIPIAALLSVLVTFGLLSRNSELTVMKACGISLYRASLSVIVLSLAFSASIFGLEQQVLPRANRKAEVIDARIRNRPARVFDVRNRQWVVGREGTIYHYDGFDPERKEMAKLRMYEPRQDAWTLAQEITADKASFRGSWVGRHVWIGDFSTGTPTWSPFDERPLPLEPPDYFETEQPIAAMMTVSQLRRYVDELSASGLNVVHLAVELQHKMAFPFVTLVMTLLAIPFGVGTGRRGALYAVGLGIILALSYWIVTSLFVALGKSGLLVPWLAAWSPNIIVLGAAGYNFLTVKT
jgi:LPS export ABC transporter permease LptG/LPS export ABC transporter permease LptF